MQADARSVGVAVGATLPNRTLSHKAAGMADDMSSDRVGFNDAASELYAYSNDFDSVQDLIERVSFYAERLRTVPKVVRISHINAELQVPYRPGVGFDLARQYYERQQAKLLPTSPRFIDSPRMASLVLDESTPYQLDPRRAKAIHEMLRRTEDVDGLTVLQQSMSERMQLWRSLGYAHEVTALVEGRKAHAPTISDRDPVNADLLHHVATRLAQLDHAPAVTVKTDHATRQISKSMSASSANFSEALADLATAANSDPLFTPSTLVLQRGRQVWRFAYEDIGTPALQSRLESQRAQAEAGLLASIHFKRFDSGYTSFMQRDTLETIEHSRRQIIEGMTALAGSAHDSIDPADPGRQALQQHVTDAYRQAVDALLADKTDSARRRQFAHEQLQVYLSVPNPDLPPKAREQWLADWPDMLPHALVLEQAQHQQRLDQIIAAERQQQQQQDLGMPMLSVARDQVEATRHLFQLNVLARVSPNTPEQTKQVLQEQLAASYRRSLTYVERDPNGASPQARLQALERVLTHIETPSANLAQRPEWHAVQQQLSPRSASSVLAGIGEAVDDLRQRLVTQDYQFATRVHLVPTQHGQVLRAQSFDGQMGYAEQVHGGWAPNGDRSTGEFLLEDHKVFFRFRDAAGQLYESEELPQTHYDLTHLPDNALHAAIEHIQHELADSPAPRSGLLANVVAHGSDQQVRMLRDSLLHKLEQNWPGEQWQLERQALSSRVDGLNVDSYIATAEPHISHWLIQTNKRLQPDPTVIPATSIAPQKVLAGGGVEIDASL